MKINLYNSQGVVTDKTLNLSEEIFNISCHQDLLAQAVRVFLFNQQKGTACTKTRAQVSGGGRKPWRQKGTGRARHGSIRSPLWVGGGVAHGPKSGARRLNLSERMRKLAFLGALSCRASNDEIRVVESFSFPNNKTKVFSEMLSTMGVADKKIAVVLSNDDSSTAKLASNLENVLVARTGVINTYDVLNCSCLIFDKDSLKELESRCLPK